MKGFSMKVLVFSGMLLAAVLAPAAILPGSVQAEQMEAPTIHVNGYAQQEVVPDTAVITVGVETTAEDAASARQNNNDSMQNVTNAILNLGIDKASLKTTGFSLRPIYESASEHRIKAYTVSNTMQVKVKDFNQISAVIDQAEKAGANQIYGIRFSAENTDAVKTALIRQAIQNGKKEADSAANAAGYSLGRLKQIDVSGVSPSFTSIQRGMGTRAGGSSTATPVEAGTATVSATVKLVYYLN